MSEFCPENVNRSDAGRVSSQETSSPSPASVAPQEEWRVVDTHLLYSGKTHITSTHSCHAGELICDAHNSRLREDKKEIERLREALEKICGQTDPGTFEHKVANSALSSSLDKRVVNTPHPSPTESPSIPEHGDVIP